MQVRVVGLPDAGVAFYDNSKKKNGDEFELLQLSHFSHVWMKALDFDPPPPKSQVERQMQAVAKAKARLADEEKYLASLKAKESQEVKEMKVAKAPKEEPSESKVVLPKVKKTRAAHSEMSSET